MQYIRPEVRESAASHIFDTPLVVDLDGTLVRTDTLDENFVAALSCHPWATLCTLLELRRGIGHFKEALARIAPIDVEMLPAREDVVAYVGSQQLAGRSVHLATAAARQVADAVAVRFGPFESVHATENGLNLKGTAKAARLVETFPGGFAYMGDSRADLAIWREAKAAVVVQKSQALERRLRSAGIPIEQTFDDAGSGPRNWLEALRVHQWSKNGLVLVPVVLAWHQVTAQGVLAAVLTMLLLGLVASLTYCINDLADLSADRRHWSKCERPFASGALPIRDGIVAAALGIPFALALGLLLSPAVAMLLALYVAITLAYSFGLKRMPLLDTFIIAALFTLRILLGTVAAGLAPSPWLLTFSMFFFFSLAVAKRHTELLRAGQKLIGKIEGRGYHVEDKDVTFAFGIVAAVASVLIIVIYLVDEVFARNMYGNPAWLWVAPMIVFLWSGRIWLLAHRGLMTDDPVLFAIHDRVSLALGMVLAVAFLLAI